MIDIVATRAELYHKFLPKNAVGAELGVYAGDNAKILAQCAEPHTLYLCDDWSAAIPPEIYQSAVRAAQQYAMMVIVRQRDQDWLPTIPDNFLDWVYIDSLHTYEHTKLELQLLRGKVTQIVAGHDLCCTSYHRDNMSVADEWRGGVMLALMEEIAAGWLEMIAITRPASESHDYLDLFPSWVCKVR